MPSPFPGMDPFLEARWPSVHGQLASFMAEALQPILPSGLRARSQENIVLESNDPDIDESWREADTIVFTPKDAGAYSPLAVAERGGSAVLAAPIRVRREGRIVRDRWVDILDSTRGGRVITAIEILSPANKRAGRHNRRYRDKLLRYEEADVSVVELDLIRSSRRRLPVTAEHVPANRRTPYYACLLRGDRPHDWEVYPLSLRAPLPPLPIPCRPGEADVPLPLQALMDRVYVAGAHDDIDYEGEAQPPLRGADALWASAMLAARQSEGVS